MIKFSLKHLFIIEQDSLIFSLNIPVFNVEKMVLYPVKFFFIYRRPKTYIFVASVIAKQGA